MLHTWYVIRRTVTHKNFLNNRSLSLISKNSKLVSLMNNDSKIETFYLCILLSI